METKNALTYTTQRPDAEGNNIVITIKLADECRNGHNDFSITGSVYQKGKPHIDRYCIGGGAMGDTIAALYPEFKIFNDLHLCDYQGAPMYAEANGFYHLKNSPATTVLNYLRITPAEYTVLATAEDENYFNYLLMSLAIPARWQKEANKAIAQLEYLTGDKFKDNSYRSQYTPLSEIKVEEITQRISEGYYSAENIAAREIQKKEAAKQKTLDELEKTLNASIKKHQDEYDVKAHIVHAGLPIDNFIYYNHTNTGVFNWKGYGDKLSKEQFDKFVNDLPIRNIYPLPEGITFKFGEK